MKNVLDTLMKMGIDISESESRIILMRNDEVYNKYVEDLEKSKAAFKALDLPAESKQIIEAYMDCCDKASLRAEYLSYFAGIRDEILFYNSMELVK